MVPENRGLFTQLTVAENLRLRKRKSSSFTLAMAYQEFPQLELLQSPKTGLLSGGGAACARELGRFGSWLCVEPRCGCAGGAGSRVACRPRGPETCYFS